MNTKAPLACGLAIALLVMAGCGQTADEGGRPPLVIGIVAKSQSNGSDFLRKPNLEFSAAGVLVQVGHTHPARSGDRVAH